MNLISRIYYILTAHFPRLLPRTTEEYDHLKDVLVDAYGVPNEPKVWGLVAGFITNTPPTQIRRPWAHIANAAKRIAINELASSQRQLALMQNFAAAKKKAEPVICALNLLFENYPVQRQWVLDGKDEGVSFFMGELTTQFPDHPEISAADWTAFIKGQALESNTQKAKDDQEKAKIEPGAVSAEMPPTAKAGRA